jgi:hypothetical protein
VRSCSRTTEGNAPLWAHTAVASIPRHTLSGIREMRSCSLLSACALACPPTCFCDLPYRVCGCLGPPGFSPELAWSLSACEIRYNHSLNLFSHTWRKAVTLQWMIATVSMWQYAQEIGYNTQSRDNSGATIQNQISNLPPAALSRRSRIASPIPCSPKLRQRITCTRASSSERSPSNK